ncbi:MAG: arylsulfatase [Ignavibacteriae bacterium]|nr:arylsulfatase [Ignavibacteriota bacterium]
MKLFRIKLSAIIITSVTFLTNFKYLAQEENITRNKNKPNIILILADDLGYGELGVFGQQKIETPNIDKLAKSGIKFTQFYSGSAVCAPSRCALLTGHHTGHSYIRGNDEWEERGDVWDFTKVVEDANLEGQRPIPDSIPTLSLLLKNSGYKTALIGKWGLGAPLSDGIPNNLGFDFFYGYNCQRQAHTYYPKHLWRNKEKELLSNKLIPPHQKINDNADPYDLQSYSDFNLIDYAPELMQKEAIKFINENKKESFFLYYASNIPHVALQAPQKWIDYYVKKFEYEKPYDGSTGYFPSRYPHATYAAMISYLDEQVGEIISELKKLEIYENTLIIFTSDNGASFAGGADPTFFNSGGIFNSEYGRGKGFLYEAGIRVPFIASWPNKIKTNSQSDHISAFWDILPTLCDIQNIPTPKNIDGNSFMPTLFGKKQEQPNYLYFEIPEYGGQQAVRLGNYKAVRKDIKNGNMKIELYDLSNDIREENNIADINLEIVKQVENIMRVEHVSPSLEKFKMKTLGDN